MSARTLLRMQIAAIVQQINALGSFGWNVQSPADWNTQEGNLPAVIINSPSDHRQAWSRGESCFTTTVDIRIEARAHLKDTAAAAQTAIDAMMYAIENAVFTDYALVRAIQQFVSTSTQTRVNAEGNGHLGSATFDLSIELPEVFDPFPTNADGTSAI
jgi:hypothetical protein